MIELNEQDSATGCCVHVTAAANNNWTKTSTIHDNNNNNNYHFITAETSALISQAFVAAIVVGIYALVRSRY